MECRWVLLLVAAAAILDCLEGRRSDRYVPKPNSLISPSCDFDTTANVVFCQYLKANDMDVLKRALDNATATYPAFGLFMQVSDGLAIPTDILQGYPLNVIEFTDCHFLEMPYEMLSYVNSNVSFLDIPWNNFTSAALSTTDLVIPFAESLINLGVEDTNINHVDRYALAKFKNLQKLFLDNNELKSIEYQLLGMEHLIEVHFDGNKINAIESGAFRDLKNLEYLDLGQNRLTYLQEEAFDGLENSPITTMLLTGNPFNCTCDLQWLKDWLNDRNLAYDSGAKCLFPSIARFDEIEFC